MRASLDGRRFGRWTVLCRAGTVGRQSIWQCRCDCGTESVVRYGPLTRGLSRSCGCLARERSSVVHTIHGNTRTPEWQAWSSMRRRCENPKHRQFADYGGRGIVVCARWGLFANFLADMGPRPSAKHSIDRINNDRGYWPDNCRWATRFEQANNRRINVRITIHGVVHTLAEWSRVSGTNERLIAQRLGRGWSAERAVYAAPVDPVTSGRESGRVRRARRESARQEEASC